MKAIAVSSGRRWGLVAGAVLLLLVSPLFAPQLLAFGHKAQVGDDTVWSEEPIDEASLSAVMDRADALLARGGLPDDRQPLRIFLTDGGWRWHWLATSASGGFALTRPLTDPVIVVNRSAMHRDIVQNGAATGGQRKLSSIIAHEATHQILRDRYGIIAMATKPQWLVEGYCDHVSGESSLSDAEVTALERAGETHPALPYYRGRRHVAALLEANGGDVDALFLGPVPPAP